MPGEEIGDDDAADEEELALADINGRVYSITSC